MKHDITTLRGIVPPVLTPLNPDQTVDLPSFTRLIEHLISGGVHGLFFLGSTGEVVFHDGATRRLILEHAMKVVNGRVPVLAGVVEPGTERVLARARDAAAIGVDAVVVTAPFYTRTHQAEVLEHFRMVAEASPIKVVAYNIPVCVHIALERATLSTLAHEGAIVGVKDSSGNAGNMRYVLNDLADTKVWCLTGGELCVDGELLMGVHGCVPGLGNVDPAAYVRLWNAAEAGDWAAARREQDRLARLFEIVFCPQPRASAGAAGLGAFKTALKIMGIIDHATSARPQSLFEPAETTEVMAILREVGLFT